MKKKRPDKEVLATLGGERRVAFANEMLQAGHPNL